MFKVYFFIALFSGAACYGMARYLWIKDKEGSFLLPNRRLAILLMIPVMAILCGQMMVQMYLESQNG